MGISHGGNDKGMGITGRGFGGLSLSGSAIEPGSGGERSPKPKVGGYGLNQMSRRLHNSSSGGGGERDSNSAVSGTAGGSSFLSNKLMNMGSPKANPGTSISPKAKARRSGTPSRSQDNNGDVVSLSSSFNKSLRLKELAGVDPSKEDPVIKKIRKSPLRKQKLKKLNHRSHRSTM